MTGLRGGLHLVLIILLRDLNLNSFNIVQIALIDIDLVQLYLRAFTFLLRLLRLLLDIVQEIGAQLLLRRLARVSIHIVIIIVNTFAEIKLEMGMHVLL